MFTKWYLAVSEYMAENPEILGLLGFIAMCALGLAFAYFVYH